MVQAVINISEEANRVINIVKARHGLRTKSEAINKLADEYEDLTEPELRPEFIREMKRIAKEPHLSFKNVEELKRFIYARANNK
ncbi:DUF2683 family protein [Candidatus Woesearchaeota archaeon]|nr:DUF2683 family protein [Candidatus Woesearchaeota archaeon]